MGLLSAKDAIMDLPMSSVLADIPVQQEIKEALLGQAGRFCLFAIAAGQLDGFVVRKRLAASPEAPLPDLLVHRTLGLGETKSLASLTGDESEWKAAMRC